jgi:hypothetical protein
MRARGVRLLSKPRTRYPAGIESSRSAAVVFFAVENDQEDASNALARRPRTLSVVENSDYPGDRRRLRSAEYYATPVTR